MGIPAYFSRLEAALVGQEGIGENVYSPIRGGIGTGGRL